MAHSPRPTLPPLHSLHLPTLGWDQDSDCHRIPPPSASPRTPSPTHPSFRPATPAWPRKVRLIPTSFENADAVVLVPPPSAPNAPPPQPLLLVGPALARLRHPQRLLAKGARIHPYRIARPVARRPSTGPADAKA